MSTFGLSQLAITASPKVLGAFTIREYIASGGIAQVYRGLSTGGQVVAIKVIPLGDTPNVETERKKILREMRIHETLKHLNVLELLGGEQRQQEGNWPEGLYIVLSLASGGDLFDKIAPDFGVDEDVAHLYFFQLIAGLKYLAQQGICHRDIKPENCLLDVRGNLKVSDFGLATVFKYKGRMRLLQERCGSLPYAAPELGINQPYSGAPVDIWSAGILLFTLLVGNTPWDEPTTNSPEFAEFITGDLLSCDPWTRIGGAAKQLLLALLIIDPAKRITMAEIDQMDWFAQYNPLIAPDGSCADEGLVIAKLMENLSRHGYSGVPTEAFVVATQPTQAQKQSQVDGGTGFLGSMKLYSRLSMAPSQQNNPGLSKFFSILPLATLVSVLESTFNRISIPLQNTLYTPDANEAHIRFRGMDKRGEFLHGVISITIGCLPDEGDGEGEVDGLDVCLRKETANPLEIKRLWLKILKLLPEGVVKCS